MNRKGGDGSTRRMLGWRLRIANELHFSLAFKGKFACTTALPTHVAVRMLDGRSTISPPPSAATGNLDWCTMRMNHVADPTTGRCLNCTDPHCVACEIDFVGSCSDW